MSTSKQKRQVSSSNAQRQAYCAECPEDCKPIIYKNLKSHFETCHPGKTVREAIRNNRNLTEFFSSDKAKRQKEAEEKEKQRKIREEEETRQRLVTQRERAQVEEETNNSQMVFSQSSHLSSLSPTDSRQLAGHSYDIRKGESSNESDTVRKYEAEQEKERHDIERIRAEAEQHWHELEVREREMDGVGLNDEHDHVVPGMSSTTNLTTCEEIPSTSYAHVASSITGSRMSDSLQEMSVPMDVDEIAAESTCPQIWCVTGNTSLDLRPDFSTYQTPPTSATLSETSSYSSSLQAPGSDFDSTRSKRLRLENDVNPELTSQTKADVTGSDYQTGVTNTNLAGILGDVENLKRRVELETNQQNSVRSAAQRTNESIHLPQAGANHLSSQMDELLKRMEKLEAALCNNNVQSSKSLPAPKSSQQAQSVLGTTNEDDLRAASSARSITKIMEHLPNWKYHFDSEENKIKNLPNGLYCNECVDKDINKGDKIKGLVHYDFAKGDSFKYATEDKIPREFSKLKSKIHKHHTQSQTHDEKVRERLQMEKQSRTPELIQRNKAAGMILARNAYKAITVNCSQKSFEWENAIDAAKGLDIGSKNHGRTFATNITDCMYDVLKDEIRNQLNQPLPGTGRKSPVSLIADHYTPNRRTLDVVGANVYIGDKVETLFVSADVVTDLTGIGSANQMIDAGNDLFGNQEWKTRFTGTAVDGGMLNKNYTDSLNSSINANPEAHGFYNHSWDSGHLLERAADDSIKKCPDNKWVKERSRTIKDIHTALGYGKALQVLHTQVEEQQQATGGDDNDEHPGRLRAPITFSDTRWATYAKNVYDSFHANYPHIYNKLANDMDPDHNRINNVSFVMETTGLQDIYEEVSLLSRTLQVPNLYSWESSAAVRNTVKNFRNMSAGLLAKDAPVSKLADIKDNSGRPLLSNFSKTVEGVSNPGNPTFKGKGLFFKEHVRVGNETRACSGSLQHQEAILTKYVEKSSERLAKFADTVASNIEKRFTSNQLPINTVSEEVFSLKKICERPSGDVPETSLNKYADLAKASGYIEHHYTNEDLKRQYSEFSQSVYENVKQKFENETIPRIQSQIEHKFYNDTIYRKVDTSDFKEVAHLAASATVRLSNESQAESMGSVLRSHQAKARGNLQPETLTKEVFLSWNGPPPTEKANPLFEKSLIKHFKGGPENWNFTHTCTRPDMLVPKVTSLVVDRLNKIDGRVKFDGGSKV